MSKVIEIQSAAQFAEILADGYDVVVDFSAKWCLPCRKLQPHLDKASEQVDATLVMVDIDKFPELSNAYGIMSVPTVLRFRDGVRDVVQSRTAIQLVKELKE